NGWSTYPLRKYTTLSVDGSCPLDYRTYQWNVLEAFRAQNIYLYVNPVFFGYELKLLISTAGGRFPRAWLEPPCASHSGVSRLMLFPQMFSVGRVIAVPGVAAFRSNQRCSASDYE